MGRCLICIKTRCQALRCNHRSPAILNNKQTQLIIFNSSRRVLKETSSGFIIQCKYKTLSITNNNLLLKWIITHGWIEWEVGNGIILNNLIWWVSRSKQACKDTNNNKKGWWLLIVAAILLKMSIVLSQLILKWCNLTNSLLKAMIHFSKTSSSLTSKANKYLMDSPNLIHTSHKPRNSMEECHLLPPIFRCLLTTRCQPSKWCSSSNNSLCQQHHHLKLTLRLLSPIRLINFLKSFLTHLSLKMEVRLQVYRKK